MRKLNYFLIIIFVTIFTFYGKALITRITLDGPVEPIRANYIISAIKKAQMNGTSFILLEINTPGGFGTSMKGIIQAIMNSKIPVVTFVTPRGAHAASAGFFILISSDVATMCEGTNTGAAHPLLAIGGVYPVPEDKKTQPLFEKIKNDFLAYLRGIVKLRNRNQKAAVEAVTKSTSYTADEALEKGLINLTAKDQDDLLNKLDGYRVKMLSGSEIILKTKNEIIKTVEMSKRQKLLSFIANPNLAVILALVGILGLFFEFSHPGFIAPGVIGAICIVLSLLGFSFLPINYVGVILIILAIGFFIAEIKVQGFGVLGIGGIVSMALGFLILIRSPDPNVGISTSVILGIVVPVGIIILLLTRLVIKAMSRPSLTGKEGMVGEKGIAETDLSPSGKIFSHGEYWDAESVSGKVIPNGTEVIVVKAEGLKLYVKPLKEININK